MDNGNSQVNFSEFFLIYHINVLIIIIIIENLNTTILSNLGRSHPLIIFSNDFQEKVILNNSIYNLYC